METQTKAGTPSEAAAEPKRAVKGESVVGYAILGCLVAGTIGVIKGLSTEGFAGGFYLLTAVAAFGTVCHIYFRRN